MVLEKILLVSSYSDDCAGGIVTWTGNFLNSTWAKERQVVFLNLYSNRRSKKRKISSAIRDYKKVLRFKNLLHQEKLNVVHINFGGSTLGLIRDCMMAKYALKRGFRVFMQCHCDAYDFYKNGFCVRRLKKIHKNGAHFLVLNDNSRTYFLQEIGALENELAYIPNFAPHQFNHSLINREIKNAIFVGHIRKAKGVDLIYSLAKEFPNVSFTLIGPDFDEVKKPKLNNLHFTGELKKDKAIGKMLDSDILLLPSFSEGLPMVVLEAMSIGLPVIASQVGDIPNVLNGTKAGLFPAGSYEDFLAEFKRFVDNFELRKEVSKLELQKFESGYETESVLGRLEQIYKGF